jgi:hypothetical protein
LLVRDLDAHLFDVPRRGLRFRVGHYLRHLLGGDVHLGHVPFGVFGGSHHAGEHAAHGRSGHCALNAGIAHNSGHRGNKLYARSGRCCHRRPEQPGWVDYC